MPGFVNWVSGQILNAADLMRLPQHNHVIKPSDESVANGTLQDDDHLLLAVAANTDYVLEGLLIYSANQPTGGLHFTWSSPAGATMLWNPGSFNNYDAQGTPNYDMQSRNIADGAVAVGLGSGGAGNAFRITARPYGILRVAGTSGTIRLRWAQAQLNAGDATVMRAGSWLRITKIS
jgi:hypothetical protein